MSIRNRLGGGATAIITAAAAFSASIATAQIMGMPGLDATQPLGQPSAPAQTDDPAAAGEQMPPSFTEAQVERGRDDYMDNCADCHGDQLDNGEFGGAPLTGSYFESHWGGAPVAALYGFISTAMPPNRPGGLNDQTYADITAFILDQNGYEPTGEELPANMEAMSNMVLNRE